MKWGPSITPHFVLMLSPQKKMNEYVQEWKEDNPYESRTYWTGPNDIITVPASETNNRASWEHDAAYAKYENPYTGSVPEDIDWIKNVSPWDPTSYVGAGVFALKSLLPAAKLKPPRESKRKMSRKRSGKFEDYARNKRNQNQQVIVHPEAGPGGHVRAVRARESYKNFYAGKVGGGRSRSQFNVRRMQKRVNRFKNSRKRSSSSRPKFGGKLRRKGYRRKRYGGKRSRNGVRKAIKTLMQRTRSLPTFSKRSTELEWQGGSAGSVGKWRYRCVDNMASTGTAVGTVTQHSMGWNMYRPFELAVTYCYGSGPIGGERYYFTNRRMTTLFQSPTNTPTFVEVYLLKCKFHCDQTDARGNVLAALNRGVTSGTAFNPGAETQLTYSAGGTVAYTPYQAYCDGILSYNPFKDRDMYKQGWTIKKKWKFVLGPLGSKSITLASKKKFRFDPESYASTEAGPGSPVVSTSDITPMARVMLVRWHGFNQLSTAASPGDEILKSNTSNDPLIVRRWHHFEMYKQDVSYNVTGSTVYSTFAETTNSNLVSYGPYNPGLAPGAVA